MKSMIVYIKLPQIHCYHILSNSTDVYLPKNYHKHYSLMWYRPTMLAHGLQLRITKIMKGIQSINSKNYIKYKN